MTGVLVGVDIGTTGLKAVAVSAEGALLREATARYPTSFDGRGAEQDALDWWRAAGETVPAVVAGYDVLAVAVTCQAPTLVALDARRVPRGRALTWVDRRAAAEAHEIGALEFGRNGPDPYHGTAKLLWWQRHTDVLDGAHAVLGANGYLVAMLTGECTVDESTTALMQAWDGEWAPGLAGLGVRVDLLPRPVPCAAVVGTVTEEAAGHTGIPAGTPVAAGGIDAVGAALEAGVCAPGDPIAEMTGFSTVTVQAVPRGTHVPGMIHSRHCFPGTDLALSAQTSTGSVKDWLCGLTGIAPSDVDDQVPRARPGRVLLVPSFAGERTPTWDADARGAVIGLDLGVTPGDLMLAVYEGTAFALRDNLELLDPGGTSAVRAIGGGAKSDTWLQVKADVLGRPVEAPASGHGAAVGAGLLAGLAVGHWNGPDDLRPLSAGVRARFEPDAERHAAYTERLARFRALRSLIARGPDDASSTKEGNP